MPVRIGRVDPVASPILLDLELNLSTIRQHRDLIPCVNNVELDFAVRRLAPKTEVPKTGRRGSHIGQLRTDCACMASFMDPLLSSVVVAKQVVGQGQLLEVEGA